MSTRDERLGSRSQLKVPLVPCLDTGSVLTQETAAIPASPEPVLQVSQPGTKQAGPCLDWETRQDPVLGGVGSWLCPAQSGPLSSPQPVPCSLPGPCHPAGRPKAQACQIQLGKGQFIPIDLHSSACRWPETRLQSREPQLLPQALLSANGPSGAGVA